MTLDEYRALMSQTSKVGVCGCVCVCVWGCGGGCGWGVGSIIYLLPAPFYPGHCYNRGRVRQENLVSV